MHKQIWHCFAFIITMNDLHIIHCDYKCKTIQTQTKLALFNSFLHPLFKWVFIVIMNTKTMLPFIPCTDHECTIVSIVIRYIHLQHSINSVSKWNRSLETPEFVFQSYWMHHKISSLLLLFRPSKLFQNFWKGIIKLREWGNPLLWWWATTGCYTVLHGACSIVVDPLWANVWSWKFGMICLW